MNTVRIREYFKEYWTIYLILILSAFIMYLGYCQVYPVIENKNIAPIVTNECKQEVKAPEIVYYPKDNYTYNISVYNVTIDNKNKSKNTDKVLKELIDKINEARVKIEKINE